MDEIKFFVLQALAFRDVNPVAPKHILVIPRKPITQLAASTEEDIPVSVLVFVLQLTF